MYLLHENSRCVGNRSRLCFMWHSRQKANPWRYCHMNRSFCLFPVPAYKHFTVRLRCDGQTSGEDSLQVSSGQTASRWLSDRSGAVNQWFIPGSYSSFSFSYPLSHLPSSHLKHEGATANLLSVLCFWSSSTLFFSPLAPTLIVVLSCSSSCSFFESHPPPLLSLQACDVSVDCAEDQLSACKYLITKTSY